MYEQIEQVRRYCNSLTSYSRRQTREVKIGDIPLGGNNPIRVQSMTTVDTMDTQGSIAQCIRMADAGCEYIRITAPSVKEAANLENIKKGLLLKGYKVPLIADIHFTPNAAELAARLVEKVRINPGNYADKKRFESIDYTDESYALELDRIRDRFIPLIKICKEYGTAMRIGTNHGSLSDRILSRYGDTPFGMVESALEFLRICEEMNYYDVVLSMKASNTQVMVQAYRLLVQKLEEEGLQPYPLHLGVTEAGEAEDGRIKSAVGIGTLLEDGLGDTVRVSLTEAPEFEVPVAAKLVKRYDTRLGHSPIQPYESYPIDPYFHSKRATKELHNIGGSNVPRVIADVSRLNPSEMHDLKCIGHHYLPATDKWALNDVGADFVYSGDMAVPFMLANGTREILNFETWLKHLEKEVKYPLIKISEWGKAKGYLHPEMNFIRASDTEILATDLAAFAEQAIVWVLYSDNEHRMAALRRAFVKLIESGNQSPVIIQRNCAEEDEESLLLYAATDAGSLFVDGLGDGIWLTPERKNLDKTKEAGFLKTLNETAFGILQAARQRMSKTEYISCPSCGRTLFDLQETTAMIRKRTDHLKGIKIGIMGCIVNGPGEMADADYGYVGVGKDKIALYRGQNVVKKFVAAEKAVDELIELIREDGKWLDPESVIAFS